MSAKPNKWTIRQIETAPRQGIWLPGALHETSDRLWQSRHGVHRIAAVAACAGLAVLGIVVLYAALGLPGAVGSAKTLVLKSCIIALVPIIATLLLYHVRISRWELDRAKGLASIYVGGPPLRRCRQFPLRAVRRVVLSPPLPKVRRDARVGLGLTDDAGTSLFLPLARYRRGDRAQALAARLSDWLGVPQAAEPDDVPLADVRIDVGAGKKLVVPASPVTSRRRFSAAAGSTRAGRRLAAYADGQRLVFEAGPFPRIVLGLKGLAGAGCLAVAWAGWLPVPPVAGWLLLGPLGVLLLLFSTEGQWALPHFDFDRRRGLLRYRAGLRVRSRTVPLEQVAAVQILYFGLARIAGSRERFQAFELNLVRTDGGRINMAFHAARDGIREHGRRIAEFLAVPLVNHMDPDQRWE